MRRDLYTEVLATACELAHDGVVQLSTPTPDDLRWMAEMVACSNVVALARRLAACEKRPLGPVIRDLMREARELCS